MHPGGYEIKVISESKSDFIRAKKNGIIFYQQQKLMWLSILQVNLRFLVMRWLIN